MTGFGQIGSWSWAAFDGAGFDAVGAIAHPVADEGLKKRGIEVFPGCGRGG